jgi:hypothetical protein
MHLDELRRAGEWKTLWFGEEPAETVAAVRARFAERLLRRGAGETREREDGAAETGAAAGGGRRAADARARSDDVPFAEARRAHAHVPGVAQPHSPAVEHGPSPEEDAHPAVALLGARRPPPAPSPAFRLLRTDGIADGRRPAARTPEETPMAARVSTARVGLSARTMATATPATQASAAPMSSAAMPSHAALATEVVPTRSPSVAEEAIELRLTSESAIAAAAAIRDSDAETPPSAAAAGDPFDLAQALAAMLDDEADLRGADR